jgi:hypothetical protein
MVRFLLMSAWVNRNVLATTGSLYKCNRPAGPIDGLGGIQCLVGDTSDNAAADMDHEPCVYYQRPHRRNPSQSLSDTRTMHCIELKQGYTPYASRYGVDVDIIKNRPVLP